jgi:hypothetical protein
VPTSVLLAVLAAAGLLALAPALVRRYDATERLVAERALSTARVLVCAGQHSHRRRRTVPGRRPVNPPRVVAPAVVVSAPVSSPPNPARVRRSPQSRAVYRRRRVFAALLVLNLVELVGVLSVGPGFWVSETVSGALLLAYLVHMRNCAIAERRRRRAQARYAAWIAARQAAVREEQARRAAARREALQRQLEQRDRARVAARAPVHGPGYVARVAHRYG